MPNYDIIPLATDLLDYTIQRVKVKEPQYTKVKAYVMENGQMVEKELFEKSKDDGKPHFPKSQTFHMCADMQRMASAILQKCNSADGRYFETEYEERLKDLDEVIVLCDTLNQYINLSYKRKYISGDQCHYWAELVRPVRQKAFNWKRNDSNRAAALREAKANQELAKEYLAQSSYQPGDVFTILTTNENNRDKLALVIASQLEAIGITCEVEAYDYPTMNSYTYDPSLYDMYVMSYSSVPLPTLKAYLSTGDSFWTTDETYQAYISQFNQATTKEEAYKIWETIQAYCWNDYLPVINCGHYQECYAWNGNTLSNVNIYNNIAHMWSASLS